MEFHFETTYDQNALKAMARALRKTVRKKRSRRSTTFGCLTILLGLLLLFSAAEINPRVIITAAAVTAVMFALLFQDDLNGHIAGKRSMPGLNKAVTIFHESGYHSITAIGESDFPYHNILLLAEDKKYFIFIFSTHHGQIYDKSSLTGGSLTEFMDFLSEKTGKEWLYI